MALLDSFIMVSCMGMSGQQNEACLKAMEAGFKQTGFQQSANAYEEKNVKLLEQDAYLFFGKDNVTVVGGAVWVAKSFADKKATFDLPNFGLCDKIFTQIESGGTHVFFKWNFK